MKNVLIINYDLVYPRQNHERLLQKIKAYPHWAYLGGSAYLILTESTVGQVCDSLAVALDKGDKLYVGASPAPSAFIGMPEEVAKWIHGNQR